MAEFLIRNRRSSAALDVWEPMAGRDARSFIHASAWSKLSRPLRAKVKPPATDDPQLQRLVTALVSLPRRNFYDVEGFGDESELPDLEELFWLSLLELIRTGNFVGALDAKAAHKPRGGTYNPVVFRDLCQVLHYRVEGELSSAKCPVKLDDSAGQLPYVTNQLDALETLTKSLRLFKSLGRIGTKTNANSTATTSETVSEHGEQLAMLERQLLEPAVAEVVALLDERAIFPAVLLAGGWAEAALLMTRPRAEVPRWLQSQWIAALQTNRSREDVVAYIESLAPLDESREVLLAESIVPIEERRAEAIAVLKRHSGAVVNEWLFSLGGFDVVRAGVKLVIDGLPIDVAADCDGLDTLQAMLSAGGLLGFLYFRNAVAYWWVWPVLVCFAWAANTIRIFVFSVAGLNYGADFVMGDFHDWGGTLAVSLMFALCAATFTVMHGRGNS
jgi:exosortase/archaeosortase family protein